ncbi:MAG: hypothetical protein IJ481_03295, partial [Alphaproteobacteria bacterium]|nr:hypothetical protein [Alphaproteobacteria bacterium]
EYFYKDIDMSKTTKYKVLLYLAILWEGNIGEVYSEDDYLTVDSDITIGNYVDSDTKVVTGLTNTPNYNYWSTEEDNTYVFNRGSNNDDIYWKTTTVTIDEDYTLKLITNYTNGYYYVLYCDNTFTNNGNVIIDNYGGLAIDYNNNTTIDTSINNGTININNGELTLCNGAILNNTGTITLTGSSFIYIYNSTLSNKGTIDISNITDLSRWYNDGTFTLKGGSTFILPKSISTNKIGSTGNTFKPITLNGTNDNPVNIVIPKGCEYIKDTDNNNKYALFEAIKEETGFTFNGNKNNVKFSWQKEDVKKQQNHL